MIEALAAKVVFPAARIVARCSRHRGVTIEREPLAPGAAPAGPAVITADAQLGQDGSGRECGGKHAGRDDKAAAHRSGVSSTPPDRIIDSDTYCDE